MQSVKSQFRDLKTGKVKFIEGDNKVRTNKCIAEIKEILIEDACILISKFVFSGGEIVNSIVVKMIKGTDAIITQKCLAKIDVVLEAYDCILIPEMMFSGGNIADRVKVIAKPRDIIVPPGGSQN